MTKYLLELVNKYSIIREVGDMKAMEKKTVDIDFVITWVDGSDTEWLQEKKKYNPTMDVDESVARYRDWGTLKYLLRLLEGI